MSEHLLHGIYVLVGVLIGLGVAGWAGRRL